MSSIDVANGTADTYLESDDYKRRLAARDALGAALVRVMDENRLDALAYPTTRRIAPIVGGGQAGSNAGLSAQTGFPAITVPAGFTSTGFPVGIELIGRRFAEPTLLSLAFSFEQATHHRRPPSSTPPIGKRSTSATPMTPVRPGASRPQIAFTATGAHSSPPSDAPFSAVVRIAFDEASRQLSYEIVLSERASGQVGGVYLHRRSNRQNGGVAYVLSKSPRSTLSGTLTLLEAEAADLKAGKFYVSIVSTRSPRIRARADLTLPSTKGC
jgi:hypothetical protein